MARIAHISDLHLVEDTHHLRRGAARLRLEYLSAGRTIDARERWDRVMRALRRVCELEVDHLVVTGDLTEDGVGAQFEVLSDALDAAAIDPARVTLVPGNHDAYAQEGAWARALAGPLARFARTSAPAVTTVVGDAVVVAISTAVAQPLLLAQGEIDAFQMAKLAHTLDRFHRDGRTIVVAQHHGPERRPGAMQWLDGLRGYERQRALMAEHANAAVLHGHTHRAADRPLDGAEHPRVFSAPAVVDSDDPVRVYETGDGRVRPLSASRDAAFRARLCA
jgi:3',5'-cyclic AMP phosphodiesterase CpdA